MAKTRKTSEAFEKSTLPTNEGSTTRTELRDQDENLKAEELEGTKSRMETFFAEKDGRSLVGEPGEKKEATPVGGETPPDSKDGKPLIAEVTPEPPKEGTLESMEQFDERIERDFQPTKKADEGHYRGIKGAMRKEHQLALEYEQKMLEATAKLKETEQKILPESEINRLRWFEKIATTRFVEDLPKWKEYDQAVEEIEKGVVENLKGFGVPEATIDAIQKRGGIAKFSTSTALAGGKFKNADGSPMTEKQWFEKYVIEQNNLTQQDKIKLFSMIQKAEDKINEKTTELEKARSDAKGTIEKETADANQRIFTALGNKLKEVLPKELPRFGFPTEPPKILATDSAEEKKDKEVLIKAWEKADKFISEAAPAMAAGPIKPEYAAEWALKVALYDELTQRYEAKEKTIEDLKARNKELEDKWNQVKNARRLPKTPIEKEPIPTKVSSESTAEERLAAANFKL
jgi:hypothetical protein